MGRKDRKKKITAIGLAALMILGTLGNTGVTARAEDTESEAAVEQNVETTESPETELAVQEMAAEEAESVALQNKEAEEPVAAEAPAEETTPEKPAQEEPKTEETVREEPAPGETESENAAPEEVKSENENPEEVSAETVPENTVSGETPVETPSEESVSTQSAENPDSIVENIAPQTEESGQPVAFTGEVHDLNNTKLTINSENRDQFNGKVITGTLENQGVNQFVIDGVEISLTFRDLTVQNAGAYNNSSASGLVLKKGAVLHLTLEGTNVLKAGFAGAGITVPEGCTLEITGNSTGILEATGGGGWNAGAGIGADGRSNQSVGTIIIRGGTVKATGNNSYSYGSVSAASAGIGGTTESKSGTIQITGGTVTAVGGMYAAGIGGGSNGRTEKIEISGGTITAIGGSQYSYSGAAIGSGHNSWNASKGGEKLSCGEIIISNGIIHAEGNIGYGTKLDLSENEGGSVDITGPVQLELTRGEIVPRKAGSTYKYYQTRFQIYDTRFGTETAEHSAVVQLGNQIFSCKLSISEAYTGTISLGVVDTQGVLKQDIDVNIVDMNANSNWQSTVSFTEEGDHTVSIGKPFYPVNLCFMDSSITGEIEIKSLKVTDENNEEYTAANGRLANSTVIQPETGKPETGTLRAWLPEGTYTFTIDTGKPEWGTNGVITVQGTVKADSNGTTIIAYRGDTAVMQDDIDLSKGDITFGVSNGLLTISMTDAEGNARYYENQPWDLTYTITTSAVTDHQVRIYLAEDYRLNLKLKNVQIDRTNIGYDFNQLKGAISLSTEGTVALYLEGENSIRCKTGVILMEKIRNPSQDLLRNCHLIFEESSGSLFASGGQSTPVIGAYSSSGSIEINGGNLTVQASSAYKTKPAAIGVGNEGEAEIKIRGGVILASTNGDGTAIGPQRCSDDFQKDGSASVEISGGEVTVENTTGNTALGKTSTNGCNLNISGGNVIVKQGAIDADTLVIAGGSIYRSDGGEAEIRPTAKNGTGADAQNVYYARADVSEIYGKNAAVTGVEGFQGYQFQNMKTDDKGVLHIYLPAEEGNLLSGTFAGITYQGTKEDPIVLSNFQMKLGQIGTDSADVEFQGIEKGGTIYYTCSGKEASVEDLIQRGTKITLNGKNGAAKLENLTPGETYTISAAYVVNGKHGGVRSYTFRCESAEPPLVNGVYEISTAEQMVWFGKYVNTDHPEAKGKLMADIDLSGITWEPMCPDGEGYTGVFDGNGHVIRNLSISQSVNNKRIYNYRTTGFFAYLGVEAVLQNLGIENAEIKTSGLCTYGGVLVGVAAYAKMQNCYSSGTIVFEKVTYAGGVIGYLFEMNKDQDCSHLYTTYEKLIGSNGSSKNISPSFFVAKTEGDVKQQGTGKTLEQFKSGEVTWLLNDQKSDDSVVWRQTLATNAFPGFHGRIVYTNEAGTYQNDTFETPTAELFTFVPPENLEQNGEKKEASVYLNSGITGMGTFTVRYKKSDETSYLASAPTEAGAYEVWISLSDGTRYNGGELQMGTFTITEPEIVSVSITWGSLEFEYQDSKWNPETCKYTESGWTTIQENDASITVTNNGNVDVDVEYRFTAAEDLTEVKNLQGIFVDEEDQPMYTLSVPADNVPRKTELRLESDKPTKSFDKTIGTINIVIKE